MVASESIDEFSASFVDDVGAWEVREISAESEVVMGEMYERSDWDLGGSSAEYGVVRPALGWQNRPPYCGRLWSGNRRPIGG